MIHKIKGNLLTDQRCEVIAHQANCQNTMGSGIARSIREMYPEAYQADTEAYRQGEVSLGNISIAEIQPVGNRTAKVVINLYGQNLYGKDKRRTDYEGVYCGLELIRKYMDDNRMSFNTIGFPRLMGCMLGGGNWRIYETMIEEVFADYNGDVYIVELVQ